MKNLTIFLLILQVPSTDDLGVSRSPRVYDSNLTSADDMLAPIGSLQSGSTAAANTVTNSGPEASRLRSFDEEAGKQWGGESPEKNASNISKASVDGHNESVNEGASQITRTASKAKPKSRRKSDSGGSNIAGTEGGLGVGASSKSKDAKVVDSGVFDPEAPSATRQERRRRFGKASYICFGFALQKHRSVKPKGFGGLNLLGRY